MSKKNLKVGDRVNIIDDVGPRGSYASGRLVAAPRSNTARGLVWLDEPIGHLGASTLTALFDNVSGSDFDHEEITKLWRLGEERFWFADEGELVVIAPPMPQTGHVPGLHHCSKGCGFTNDHADASAFVTGKYVCFQCSLWARKCDW